MPYTDLSSLTQGQELQSAVAVPSGVKPVLQISADGYSAQFSLREGRRIGTDISVLYRDASYPINNTIGLSWSIPFEWLTEGTNSPWVSTAGTPGESGNIEVTIPSATLEYTLEDDPTVSAGAPGRSLLFIEGTTSISGGIGDSGWGISPIPTNHIKLRLPGGDIIGAERADVNTGDDLWGGGVYFNVPATFSQGTLSITPGTINSVLTQSNAPAWAMTGTYTAPITMP